MHNHALIKSNNELGCLIYLIMPCCGDKLDKWEWRIHHHHHCRDHHHHDEDYDGDDDDDDDHNDDHDHDSDNMTKVMIMMRRMTIMLMTTPAAMSQNVSQWREESRWNTTEVQNDDAEQHANNWKQAAITWPDHQIKSCPKGCAFATLSLLQRSIVNKHHPIISSEKKNGQHCSESETGQPNRYVCQDANGSKT